MYSLDEITAIVHDVLENDYKIRGSNQAFGAPEYQSVKHYLQATLKEQKSDSVLQPWVTGLTFMQQSVLIAAVRGPDGIRKDHAVKVLCRWLRRSFLLCAFERIAHNDPYENCGGSFTGKCQTETVDSIDHGLELYLRSVDELPHHFQLHFMHAAEILGYKHPIENVRAWWNKAYLAIVKDAHLFPEPEYVMDNRLGDNETQWRNSEVVIAK